MDAGHYLSFMRLISYIVFTFLPPGHDDCVPLWNQESCFYARSHSEAGASFNGPLGDWLLNLVELQERANQAAPFGELRPIYLVSNQSPVFAQLLINGLFDHVYLEHLVSPGIKNWRMGQIAKPCSGDFVYIYMIKSLYVE